jgi:hypothetical protein
VRLTAIPAAKGLESPIVIWGNMMLAPKSDSDLMHDALAAANASSRWFTPENMMASVLMRSLLAPGAAAFTRTTYPSRWRQPRHISPLDRAWPRASKSH